MKLVTHTQGSPEWKAWRSGEWDRDGRRVGGGLGGSDIAGVLGLSPYTDPPHNRRTVFDEKVHGIEREVSFSMHRGTRLEPHARDAYQRRQRCTAAPVCVEMDGCPWARASLDGLAHDGGILPSARLHWILELKCPNWETHDAALAGVVAEHFLVQCQWQMLVCGLDRLDFASFNPGQRFTPSGAPPWDEWRKLDPHRRPPMPDEWLAVHAIEPDPDRQAWILEEAGRFWFEVLEARAQLPARPVEPSRDRSGVGAEFA